jgi:hypothetical protein
MSKIFKWVVSILCVATSASIGLYLVSVPWLLTYFVVGFLFTVCVIMFKYMIIDEIFKRIFKK